MEVTIYNNSNKGNTTLFFDDSFFEYWLPVPTIKEKQILLPILSQSICDALLNKNKILPTHLYVRSGCINSTTQFFALIGDGHLVSKELITYAEKTSNISIEPFEKITEDSQKTLTSLKENMEKTSDYVNSTLKTFKEHISNPKIIETYINAQLSEPKFNPPEPLPFLAMPNIYFDEESDNHRIVNITKTQLPTIKIDEKNPIYQQALSQRLQLKENPIKHWYEAIAALQKNKKQFLEECNFKKTERRNFLNPQIAEIFQSEPEPSLFTLLSDTEKTNLTALKKKLIEECTIKLEQKITDITDAIQPTIDAHLKKIDEELCLLTEKTPNSIDFANELELLPYCYQFILRSLYTKTCESVQSVWNSKTKLDDRKKFLSDLEKNLNGIITIQNGRILFHEVKLIPHFANSDAVKNFINALLNAPWQYNEYSSKLATILLNINTELKIQLGWEEDFFTLNAPSSLSKTILNMSTLNFYSKNYQFNFSEHTKKIIDSSAMRIQSFVDTITRVTNSNSKPIKKPIIFSKNFNEHTKSLPIEVTAEAKETLNQYKNVLFIKCKLLAKKNLLLQQTNDNIKLLTDLKKSPVLLTMIDNHRNFSANKTDANAAVIDQHITALKKCDRMINDKYQQIINPFENHLKHIEQGITSPNEPLPSDNALDDIEKITEQFNTNATQFSFPLAAKLNTLKQLQKTNNELTDLSEKIVNLNKKSFLPNVNDSLDHTTFNNLFSGHSTLTTEMETITIATARMTKKTTSLLKPLNSEPKTPLLITRKANEDSLIFNIRKNFNDVIAEQCNDIYSRTCLFSDEPDELFKKFSAHENAELQEFNETIVNLKLKINNLLVTYGSKTSYAQIKEAQRQLSPIISFLIENYPHQNFIDLSHLIDKTLLALDEHLAFKSIDNEIESQAELLTATQQKTPSIHLTNEQLNEQLELESELIFIHLIARISLNFNFWDPANSNISQLFLSKLNYDAKSVLLFGNVKKYLPIEIAELLKIITSAPSTWRNDKNAAEDLIEKLKEIAGRLKDQVSVNNSNEKAKIMGFLEIIISSQTPPDRKSIDLLSIFTDSKMYRISTEDLKDITFDLALKSEPVDLNAGTSSMEIEEPSTDATEIEENDIPSMVITSTTNSPNVKKTLPTQAQNNAKWQLLFHLFLAIAITLGLAGATIATCGVALPFITGVGAAVLVLIGITATTVTSTATGVGIVAGISIAMGTAIGIRTGVLSITMYGHIFSEKINHGIDAGVNKIKMACITVVNLFFSRKMTAQFPHSSPHKEPSTSRNKSTANILRRDSKRLSSAIREIYADGSRLSTGSSDGEPPTKRASTCMEPEKPTLLADPYTVPVAKTAAPIKAAAVVVPKKEKEKSATLDYAAALVTPDAAKAATFRGRSPISKGKKGHTNIILFTDETAQEAADKTPQPPAATVAQKKTNIEETWRRKKIK